ncbi:MAG: hypothetical protein JWN38_113 [Candidatus Saccharibacteria bacterium]|nr:hypothetical protein [Candidatus Saccharibacteria bacterium]
MLKQRAGHRVDERSRLGRAGFTIIELMIALSILSVLLLMVSVVLVQIGKMYSKGTNESSVQSTSRSVISGISSTLQFTGTQPFACSDKPNSTDVVTCAANTATVSGVTIYSYCMGTTRYSYILNHRLASSPTTGEVRHVLWQDTMGSDANCYPLDITAASPASCPTAPLPANCSYLANTGKELIPEGMRLTRFNIGAIGASSSYGIDVWVAFGADDLLNTVATKDTSPPAPNCTAGAGADSKCAGYTRCNSGLGQEYCATSQLSTTVTRRL